MGTISWTAFLALAPAATCCLVAVPTPTSAAWLDGLRAFRHTLPFTPLVLVADRTLPRAVAVFGEVARGPLHLQRLWPAMQRACTRSLLAEAAARAADASGAPPAVRAAFTLACRADPPIRSVGALAAVAGYHRRTLWRQWRSSAMASTGSVDGLLDWVLLLRASALIAEPGSAEAVADRLGVHRHTLARVAGSCAELSLRDLTPDVAPRLRTAFRNRVLDPFLSIEATSREQPANGRTRMSDGPNQGRSGKRSTWTW